MLCFSALGEFIPTKKTEKSIKNFRFHFRVLVGTWTLKLISNIKKFQKRNFVFEIHRKCIFKNSFISYLEQQINDYETC